MAQNKTALRIAAVASVVIGSLGMAPPALAQSDLFGKALKLLDGNSDTGSSPSVGSLTQSELARGLKEALRVGTERVTEQLGKADGFNGDPRVHIPLPDNLRQVQSTLRSVGLGTMADETELKLNRAAEAAMPKARLLVWDAISQMTLDDAEAIYNGPADAATRYFQSKMSAPLHAEIKPVMETTLSEVGAVEAYDAMMGRYQTLPFMPNVKADLTKWGTDKAIEGLFHYIAVEEAAIRQNPAARTTDILKKVFGR